MCGKWKWSAFQSRGGCHICNSATFLQLPASSHILCGHKTHINRNPSFLKWQKSVKTGKMSVGMQIFCYGLYLFYKDYLEKSSKHHSMTLMTDMGTNCNFILWPELSQKHSGLSAYHSLWTLCASKYSTPLVQGRLHDDYQHWQITCVLWPLSCISLNWIKFSVKQVWQFQEVRQGWETGDGVR